MPEIKVRSRASRDIADVYAFSAEQFGLDVARDYQSGLLAAIIRLADFPELGSAYPGLRPPVRYLTYRRHHVFYDFDGTTVWIVRVLHHARDVRHLM